MPSYRKLSRPRYYDICTYVRNGGSEGQKVYLRSYTVKIILLKSSVIKIFWPQPNNATWSRRRVAKLNAAFLIITTSKFEKSKENELECSCSMETFLLVKMSSELPTLVLILWLELILMKIRARDHKIEKAFPFIVRPFNATTGFLWSITFWSYPNFITAPFGAAIKF
jgi:hypothetical protein